MLTALTQGGWGVQYDGKHADIICECSLKNVKELFISRQITWNQKCIFVKGAFMKLEEKVGLKNRLE